MQSFFGLNLVFNGVVSDITFISPSFDTRISLPARFTLQLSQTPSQHRSAACFIFLYRF